MSRKRRRKEERKRNRERAARKRARTAEESASPVSWKWYAAVIVLAIVLFAVFLMTQFRPADRVAMAGAMVMCAGLGLFIPGTCKAVGNLELQTDSWFGKCMAWLVALATPKKRFGELFYSSHALYVFFEKILIAVVIPLGFLLVFLRPKQTWPSIVWVGGGILAMILGWSVMAWEAS